MELNQAFCGQKVAYKGKQYVIRAIGTGPGEINNLVWVQGFDNPLPLDAVEPMLESVPLFVRKDEPEKCPGMAEYGHGLTTTIVHAGCCDENGQKRLKKAPQGTFKKHLMAEMEDAHEDQFVNLPFNTRRELAGKFHLECCFQDTNTLERAREAITEHDLLDLIIAQVGYWTATGTPESGEVLLRTLATAITDYHAPAIQRIIDGGKL